MTQIEFIQELASVLAEDAAGMAPEIALESLAGWDSMGKLATLGFLDASFGLNVPPGTLQNCRLVRDLIELVKPQLNG